MPSESRAQTQLRIIWTDDFLFMGASKERCGTLLRTFQDICTQLRVPLAEEKTEGPCQVITYLGLEIDAIRHEIRVPRH